MLYTWSENAYSFLSTWLIPIQLAYLGLFRLGLGIFLPKMGDYILVFQRVFVASIGYLLVVNGVGQGMYSVHSFISKYFFHNIFDSSAYEEMWLAGNGSFMACGVFVFLIAASFFIFALFDRFFIVRGAEMEFSILVYLATFSSIYLLFADSFPEIILCLERITFLSYVLVASGYRNRASSYAAVQYIILGSLPTVFLIFSFVLLYQLRGRIKLSEVLSQIMAEQPLTSVTQTNWPEPEVIYPDEIRFKFSVYPAPETLFGPTWNSDLLSMEYSNVGKRSAVIFSTLVLFAAFLFKITAAPFHFWAPAIYGKSPIASATFLTIFRKVVVVTFMAKWLFLGFASLGRFSLIRKVFLVLASLSIFIGRLGAFVETRVKRFFVYSSMGHVGFMLFGLSVLEFDSFWSRMHYLVIYMLSSLIMWLLLLTLGAKATHLSYFSSFSSENRRLAYIFALLVFSRSGIPPRAGFFVKLDVLYAMFVSGQYFWLFILFVLTVISFFYYLRLIKIMMFDNKTKNYISPIYLDYSWSRAFLLSFLTIILVFYVFRINPAFSIIESELFSHSKIWK